MNASSSQFRPWAILLAAGQGNRMKAALNNTSKQFLVWNDLPLFWHSALALAAVPQIAGLVITLPESDFNEAQELCSQCQCKKPLGIEYRLVAGGELRQDSVRNALNALPGNQTECTHVLVHDSARPFVSARLIKRVLETLQAGSQAVIPGLELSDTVKIVNAGGQVLNTPERSSLRLVQTPQGFERAALQAAHQAAVAGNWIVTDDAALLERCAVPVLTVPGEAGNRKITTPEDLELLANFRQTHLEYATNGTSGTMNNYFNSAINSGISGIMNKNLLPCTGFGYDVHSYGGNRPFVLGGVRISSTDIMLCAHSDGDVLLHALIDALLGCIGGGDIGGLFPDNAPQYDNVSSSILLSEVLELTRKAGLVPVHVDLTVVAQAPKIAPFRKEIARNIAHLMQLDERRVNVKGTTEEGLGFTGAKQGIKAMAVVTGLLPAST